MPVSQEGQKLPNTATSSYNLFVLGLLILVAGGIMIFVRKRNEIGRLKD
ncbi:LPXTG cell wall anchor domain-containing protein [Neobacillus sp. CF12]